MNERIIINAKNMNIDQGNINNGIVCIGDNNSNNVAIRTKKKKNGTEKRQYKDIKKPYIFISYSHKDSNKVLQIINIMKKNGYRVWYDKDINPGPKWDQYVETVLKHSTVFISFFSEFYWKSKACIEEISYACRLTKFEADGIIPVYLDDTGIPDNLGLQMHLSARQSIFGYKYNMPEDICKMIYKNAVINKCQADKDTKN